ncbi:MAG: helix-turn-helix domain-containing protein [Clostridia bacterium]|nr:helix-turn-helix domain-containing protein [Clostridia bacterium]
MANRLFQNVIHQMKDTVGCVVGVLDETDAVVACSDLRRVGDMIPGIHEELSFAQGVLHQDGFTYRYLTVNNRNDFVIMVEGEDAAADNLSGLLAVTFGNIKSLYDERYDKSSFIKNVILDNILQSDIYIKSKEMHFDSDTTRVILLIKFYNRTDMLPFEMVQSMFPDKNTDYVIGVGDQDIVLVKEVTNEEPEEIEELAASIAQTLNADFYSKVSIGISTIVTGLKDLARAYKEARVALEVGKVFDTEKNIISYENLGIGRLIYQLPTTLCEIFLQEVFKKGSLESLDRDTLDTVQRFFEYNLNVSETSRNLFVHRNTLVYRLEKIRKITGLDLRNFDQAITFKVALMVKKYLTNKPTKF